VQLAPSRQEIKMNKPEYPEGFDLDAAIAHQNLGSRFELEENMGIRDPHTGRFKKHELYGGDLGLNVKFSVESVFSPKETFLATDGTKRYVDQDFITITIPGNSLTEIHEQVSEFYKWRFPSEYAEFKKGTSSSMNGTALEMWPALHPAQITDLKHRGIRTIEQLANLSDSSSEVLRGFYSLKSKAKQFLEDAKDKTSTENVRIQMEEQEARHKAELKAMEDRFAAMLAQALPKESKKVKPNEDLN
jgi:hypothetical protein